MIALFLAQIIDVAALGDRVATATQGKVALNGEPVPTSLSQIAGVAFAPDGTLAVFGGKPSERGELELVGKWKTADHEDMVNAVAFGPGWIATASQDKKIIIRDASGKPLRTLSGHTAGVLSLAADGTRLVSGGVDRTMRVWDAATGELKRTITNHQDRVGALAFSPDGKYLASGSRDRTLRVWQIDIGRLVRIVRGHEGEVTDLAWGDALVSGCSDGKVRVIDSDSDRIVKELDAGGWVNAVAISPKSIRAASSRLHEWPR